MLMYNINFSKTLKLEVGGELESIGQFQGLGL